MLFPKYPLRNPSRVESLLSLFSTGPAPGPHTLPGVRLTLVYLPRRDPAGEERGLGPVPSPPRPTCLDTGPSMFSWGFGGLMCLHDADSFPSCGSL